MGGEAEKMTEDMKNAYSPSSIAQATINYEAWFTNIQCPNGHYNKEIIEQHQDKVKFKCNICNRSFWIGLWKYAKSKKS
jgi:hypothetical protein